MTEAADQIGIALQVGNLLADYVDCIDGDALESWPGFFRADGRYRITTANSVAQELPIGIVQCDNRAMMMDRVAALRRANVYEAQAYRHLISAIRVTGHADGLIEAKASFLVARILRDGRQDLFATGCYLDKVDLAGPRPRYAEKLVVLDSDKIDTLLALPL